MKRLSLSGLAAIVALASLPADARTTFDEEFICPIGGERFRARVEGSGTAFCQRLDFKRVGPIGEPPLAPECPGNGFVIFSEKMTEGEVAKLEPWVASAEYQERIRHHPTYFRIAKLREFLGHGPDAVARSYLQASWQVEDRDPEAHSQYLRAAIAALDRVASAEPADGASSASLTPYKARYLAADAYRRLREFETAQHYLHDLRDTPQGDGAPLLEAIEAQLRLTTERDSAAHAAPWSSDLERCEKRISRGVRDRSR